MKLLKLITNFRLKKHIRTENQLNWLQNRNTVAKFNELFYFCLNQLEMHGDKTWHKNAFVPEMFLSLDDAAIALKRLTARHLLWEAGDAVASARIFNMLESYVEVKETKTAHFFRLLTNFISSEIANLDYSLPQRSPGNTLGIVLWGKNYIDICENYCLSSLAASGNIPFLATKGRLQLLIYTKKSDAEDIRIAAGKNFNIPVDIKIIPDDLILAAAKNDEEWAGELKYWLLGGLQSCLLFNAQSLGNNFYTLFPDHIYSKDYLRSISHILTRQGGTILSPGFSLSAAPSLGHLKKYCHQNTISINASELASIAANNMEPGYASLKYDYTNDTAPSHPTIIFKNSGYIAIHAVHNNMAAISYSELSKLRPRYYFTLDSEIDKIIPPGSIIHLQTLEDDFFCTEISFLNDQRELFKHCSIDEFVKQTNHLFTHKNLKIFKSGSLIKLTGKSDVKNLLAEPRKETETINLITQNINQLISQNEPSDNDSIKHILKRLETYKLTCD